MADTLDTIPPELQNIILNCFFDECRDGVINTRRGNFHSLCLTSRRLRLAATPYLYKEFHSLDREKGTRSLILSLCRYPELAKNLLIITVGPCQARCSRPIVAEDDSLIAHTAGAMCPTICPQEIHEPLRNGCYTAEVLFLLTLATHARFVNVDLRAFDDEDDEATKGPSHELCHCCPDMATSLKAIYGSQPAQTRYRQLRYVALNGETHPWLRTGDPVNLASAFLHLPSLRTLVCDGLGSHGGSIEWQTQGLPSNVKDLQLIHGYPNTSDTIRTLQACKSLEKLTLLWDASRDDVDGTDDAMPDVINQRALLAALPQHAHTLRELIITNLADAGQRFSPVTGSLCSLQGLRKLEVDEHILRGWGDWAVAPLQLPPNLITLIIHVNSSLFDAHQTVNDTLLAISKYDGKSLERLELTFPFDEYYNQEYETACRNWDARDRKWTMQFKQYDDDTEERICLRVWQQPDLYRLLGELSADLFGDDSTGAIRLLSEDTAAEAETAATANDEQIESEH